MASLTQWTWIWQAPGVGDGWTGKPGMLHSMWSLRAGHNCVTEQHEPRGIWISASKQSVQNGNHFLSVPSQASSLPRRTSSLSIQMLRLKLQHHLWFLSFSHPVCLTYCKVYPAKVKVAQSCPTLCNPMNYTVHEILQARILECVVFPFSRGFSQPKDQTQVSCIAGGFFTSWARRLTLCLLKIFHNCPFLSISTHRVLY